jgi:hypothetical protein
MVVVDRSRIRVIAVALSLLISSELGLAQATRGNPRGAVTTFFNQLRTGQYESLYDQLPTEIQKVGSREQTIQSLRRLGGFITMERMEIGRVQQKGNLAVIDTTIYGRLTKPMKFQGEEISEGRVAVQQYLIKEGKEWRVITADDRTRSFFMRQNPDFASNFSLTSPRFAYKRNGAWQSLGQPPVGAGGRSASPSS